MTGSAIVLILILCLRSCYLELFIKKSLRGTAFIWLFICSFHFALFSVICMDNRRTKADYRLASIRVYVRRRYITLFILHLAGQRLSDW